MNRINTIASLVATLSVSSPASATTYPLAVNAGAPLPPNTVVALPPIAFKYGDVFDYVVKVSISQMVTLNFSAFRYEGTGVPEIPANAVRKPISCNIYHGDPIGAYTRIGSCTNGLDAIASFQARAGETYFVELINNSVAPNSFVGGTVAGYK